MKKIALVLLILSLCSCGNYEDSYGNESFSYILQGEWETTKEFLPGVLSGPGDSTYSKIVIDYQYITISGKIAHFEKAGITTRNFELKGYSTKDSDTNDSLIYVYDKGELKGPIKYSLWTTARNIKMLILKGGDNLEEETFTLKEYL
jgi:hypothetical protein